MCLVSGAALLSDGQEDKALQWFHSESGSLSRPSPNETQMPTIFGIQVVPSNLFKPLNDTTPLLGTPDLAEREAFLKALPLGERLGRSCMEVAQAAALVSPADRLRDAILKRGQARRNYF